MFIAACPGACRIIRPVGFWTTVIGDNTLNLHYMLAWQDLAERERVWPAFMSDPEWVKARTESEKNGPILAQATNPIHAPTAFSRMK